MALTLSAIQDGSLVIISIKKSPGLDGETYLSPCSLGSVSDQCSSHRVKEARHTLRSSHLILDPEKQSNSLPKLSNRAGNKLLDLIRDVHHVGEL